jgi:hypothetical protein
MSAPVKACCHDRPFADSTGGGVTRQDTALASWMTLLVNRLQAAVFHVRVDLSRPDTGVTEHFLKSSDVRAAGEKMSCEAVTQSVRTHFGSAADSTGIALHK